MTGDVCIRDDARGDIFGDFIIIPNTNARKDRFCGNALIPVTCEFQVGL